MTEVLGFMALKEEFKQEFFEACSKQIDGKSEFVDCLNYLLMSSLQYNAPTDSKKGDGEDLAQQ